jgi:HEAT repeat protein
MFKMLRFRLLVRQLKDDDLRFRAGAARRLGNLGDHRAVDSLIQALGDQKSLVRAAAAEALGKLGDPRAVDPLSEALGDREPDVFSVPPLKRWENWAIRMP